MSGYDGYSAATYGRVYSMPPYGSGGPASGAMHSATPTSYHGVSGLQQQLAAVGGAVAAAAAVGGGNAVSSSLTSAGMTASSFSKTSYNGLCLTGPGGVDLLHQAMVYPGMTTFHNIFCSKIL